MADTILMWLWSTKREETHRVSEGLRMCELAKKPNGFCHVCGSGFISSREIADVDLLPVPFNFGPEPSVLVLDNTFDTGRAVRPHALVGEVLSSGADSDVRSSVIQGVAIGVVNVMATSGGQQEPVHSDGGPNSIAKKWSDGINVSPFPDFGGGPIPVIYKRGIRRIDNRDIPACEWDASNWTVNDYGAYFHAA